MSGELGDERDVHAGIKVVGPRVSAVPMMGCVAIEGGWMRKGEWELIALAGGSPVATSFGDRR